jgi:hypothetical protein
MKFGDRSFKLKHPWDTAPLPALAPDEQDAADTQEIEIVADDTAPLDADMTAYAAFLTRLLTEGNEDDRL